MESDEEFWARFSDWLESNTIQEDGVYKWITPAESIELGNNLGITIPAEYEGTLTVTLRGRQIEFLVYPRKP